MLFQGYAEIANSYDNLTDIQTYLERYRYRGTGSSRTRYVSYHIENYLNELYILENRLKAYTKRILRSNRSAPNYTRLEELARGLIAVLDKEFQSINATRGSHVHAARFSDPELDRASSWELLMASDFAKNLPKLPDMKSIMDSSFRKAKKKWTGYVESNNHGIQELLDIYFECLYPLAFDANGKVRFEP